MRIISKTLTKALWKIITLGFLLGFLLWFYGSPVVVVHYDTAARETIGYFFLQNGDTTKEELKPGEEVRLVTDMFPEKDEVMLFSLPFNSQDSVEIQPPFSRVDIYVDASTRIARTTVSQSFFARFYKAD